MGRFLENPRLTVGDACCEYCVFMWGTDCINQISPVIFTRADYAAYLFYKYPYPTAMSPGFCRTAAGIKNLRGVYPVCISLSHFYRFLRRYWKTASSCAILIKY